MQVGSLVQYTAREGEEPSPAIVMRIWPEGTIELHVFHFESATHIRAADPSQVVPVLDSSRVEEILEEFTSLGTRLTGIENEMEELRRMLRDRREDAPSSSLKPQDDVADNHQADSEIDDVEIQTDEDEQQTAPPSVESTQKKKARKAWPR